MSGAKILPCVLMTIDVACAVVYLYGGDLRRGIYWIAAAVLTASVTF